MFTGLVQAVGTVQQADKLTDGGLRLRIGIPDLLTGALPVGASLAVNGCCLTVVNDLTQTDNVATFDLSPETLDKTTFNQLLRGQLVNLEPAMTFGTPLGGHLVTGHVDATAELVQLKPYGNSWILRFKVEQPEALALLVEKGSVAVDGVSLTVNTVIQNVFSVAIIPHTWQHTNLSQRQVGDRVNLETDLIGRYVLHLMTVGRVPTVYDEQAKQLAAQSSVPNVGGNVQLGQWFNGAPC